MKLNDIKIRTKLKLGFAALLLFVILLGAISYSHTQKIHEQTEILYNHPLQVRRAIGSLYADILSMRLGTRDLMLARNADEQKSAKQLIEISSIDALNQFEILRSQYLGPSTDVEEAYNAFLIWKVAREENTKLALSGEIEAVKESVLSTGTVGVYRDRMLEKIKVIDYFAAQKGDIVYSKSVELNNLLDVQLLLIVIVIVLLSLLIYHFLLRSVRKPIEELTHATNRFHQGDLNARSQINSKNEFGLLSDSFNSMADGIQWKTLLDEKIADLSALMLSEYDIKKFFHDILNALASHTSSQTAAIYLLSHDKKLYRHFDSIGVDKNARKSFAADFFEGEFGTVLSTRTVHHLKNIPEDTRFVFHTVIGKIIPREILTIPILADKEIIAIISLSSVDVYSEQSIMLIDRIIVTLSARIEGILAYYKLKKILLKLEQQNSELEVQKTELSMQSTELMQQNSELEIQKSQLGEANRLKTNFLSNMSHELRTPLNSIIALSGVLSRRLSKILPEEESSFIEVIERNGKNLLKLINDILDISRIEAGREEVEISTFNPINLVEEVVGVIHQLASQKNIKLTYTAEDQDLIINSDVSKCRHILQNLISNAVKFTEQGKVEILIIQSEKNITITVSDTGIGISEEHLPHIFDEFRQADSSTSRRFGGSGLGLAIAKKYANLLGGTITVKSTPEIGSEFIVSLPINYDAKNRIIETEKLSTYKHAVQQPSFNVTSVTSKKTILLVEDSEPAIIQMKDFLEESGYRLLVAHDGSEALHVLTHTIPDAIILDLMMPGIDGFEVLQTVREAESTTHIPVLILTAKHITKDELSFLKKNNIHQLIQKGDINRSELLSAVETMLTYESIIPVSFIKMPQVIEGKPVVLVVEDNPDNLITVRSILADKFTVLEAIDGKSGLEMALEHKPHLILMDIALPDIDGIKTFQAIRKNPEMGYIPIIALTASAMIQDREAILAHGFDAYISKPIDVHLFYKVINEVLYGK
ncbi:MAG: response regulator [Paludibacter sp.]|nr:response regulator [Paludibacter sp.]